MKSTEKKEPKTRNRRQEGVGQRESQKDKNPLNLFKKFAKKERLFAK